MRKKVETEFQDQTRWNDLIGKGNLAIIDDEPERFVVNGSQLNSRVQNLLADIGDLAGKRILEYGCGRGEVAVELARRGAEVTGIEIGPDLVALAKRVAEINEVTCTFHQGSITELPVDDQSFDLVIGNAILHHLPKQGVVQAVAESHRVLADGGKAYFIEPMENSKLFDLAQNLIPVGSPDDPMAYRPSILNRKAWRHYLDIVEDRTLTDGELRAAAKQYATVEFRYHGFLSRLSRVIPGNGPRRLFDFLDRYLTHPRSPLQRYSQLAVVTCSK